MQCEGKGDKGSLIHLFEWGHFFGTVSFFFLSFFLSFFLYRFLPLYFTSLTFKPRTQDPVKNDGMTHVGGFKSASPRNSGPLGAAAIAFPSTYHSKELSTSRRNQEVKREEREGGRPKE